MRCADGAPCRFCQQKQQQQQIGSKWTACIPILGPSDHSNDIFQGWALTQCAPVTETLDGGSGLGTSCQSLRQGRATAGYVSPHVGSAVGRAAKTRARTNALPLTPHGSALEGAFVSKSFFEHHETKITDCRQAHASKQYDLIGQTSSLGRARSSGFRMLWTCWISKVPISIGRLVSWKQCAMVVSL